MVHSASAKRPATTHPQAARALEADPRLTAMERAKQVAKGRSAGIRRRTAGPTNETNALHWRVDREALGDRERSEKVAGFARAGKRDR